jgi:hypothetical protein
MDQEVMIVNNTFSTVGTSAISGNFGNDFTDYKRNFSFGLMNSPTGCGLFIFYGFTGIQRGNLKDTDIRLLKSIIERKCKQNGWYAGIATLGDSFISTHERLLIDLGFEKITAYNNKGHGENYKQSIYMMTLK